MGPFVVVLGLFCVLVAVPARAQPPFDPDEGTLSSVRPRIPEPMVFDLVRPLGAEPGELEVNSLFRMTPGQQPRLAWAPEVEYTLARGYGVEVELPMEDGRLESLKLAVQGTLPGPAPRAFIHGWQGIWEREARRDGQLQLDLLYLAGARWHPRWSVFTMNGIRQQRDGRASHSWLGNYSLFFHASHKTTVGLETNLSGPSSARRLMLMPQLHVRTSRYNVQMGAGLLREGGRARLHLSWRISREF